MNGGYEARRVIVVAWVALLCGGPSCSKRRQKQPQVQGATHKRSVAQRRQSPPPATRTKPAITPRRASAKPPKQVFTVRMSIDMARLRKTPTWKLLRSSDIIKRVKSHSLYRTITRACRVAPLEVLSRVRIAASLPVHMPQDSVFRSLELALQATGAFDAPKLISCIKALGKKHRAVLSKDGSSVVQVPPIAGKPALEYRSPRLPSYVLLAQSPGTLALATRRRLDKTPMDSLFKWARNRPLSSALNPKAALWFGAPSMPPGMTRVFSALLGGAAIKAMAGTIDDPGDGYQFDISFQLASSQVALKARRALQARLKQVEEFIRLKGRKKAIPAGTRLAHAVLGNAKIELHGAVFTLRMRLSRPQAQALILPLLKKKSSQ